jgi:hypothetical protein
MNVDDVAVPELAALQQYHGEPIRRLFAWLMVAGGNYWREASSRSMPMTPAT